MTDNVNSLSWALDYKARGDAPIDVPLKSKNPARENWQDERHDEHALRARFQRPCNISVLLGEPSNWLVDVDLDSPEARSLAASFLPASQSVFGRPGNPGSHVLYQAKGVTTKRYQDPLSKSGSFEHATLVELRSTGCHTVFPESIHPSGEHIGWVYDKTPPDVTASELEGRVARLAAAALLARYWPGAGARQDASLALSGGLLRGGWDATDAESFVLAVARVAGDEETLKRARTAENTRKRLDQGGTTTGWHTLTGLVDERVVTKVREWLGMLHEPSSAEESSTSRRSQADELVEIGSACELFTDSYGTAMARMTVKAHREIWSLKSQHFGAWLRYEYWQTKHKAVGNDGLRSALGTLDGMARFQGQQHALANRVARHEDVIYYYLATGQWSALGINSNRWWLETDPPILFRRYTHQAEQVVPVSGGDPWRLFDFLNVAGEDQLLLLVWTIAAFIPDIPHPIVNFHGEKGAAKSVGQRVLRRLIDPSHAESLSFPLDRKELVQQLAHHYAPIYDNLDSLPAPISDLFCRAVTCEAFTKRELFSDDDDVIYAYRRVIMLNGINVAGQRPDLLDRTILFLFELQRIERQARRDETRFWVEYNQALPSILGGMLDALPVALRHLNEIDLREMERMADFTRYGAAITKALGREPEEFLAAYGANLARQNREALDAHQIGRLILQLMQANKEWAGSPTELLRALEHVGLNTGVLERSASGHVVTKGWPRGAHILSRRIKEVRSNLRDVGVVITEDHSGDRRIHISRLQGGKSSVHSVQENGMDAMDAGFGATMVEKEEDTPTPAAARTSGAARQEAMWKEEVT